MFCLIYRKKWNVFKRKPVKKHLLPSNLPPNSNGAREPRRSDEWPGVAWLTYLFCSCRARTFVNQFRSRSISSLTFDGVGTGRFSAGVSVWQGLQENPYPSFKSVES